MERRLRPKRLLNGDAQAIANSMSTETKSAHPEMQVVRKSRYCRTVPSASRSAAANEHNGATQIAHHDSLYRANTWEVLEMKVGLNQLGVAAESYANLLQACGTWRCVLARPNANLAMLMDCPSVGVERLDALNRMAEQDQ